MTDEAKAPMGGEVEEAVKRLTWMLGNAEGAANYDVLPDPDRDEASKDAAVFRAALAALAQPKEGEALSDEVVERAARADADMAAALLEGLEALANTPMNIDFSVWSRFAFNVQMIAKRLRRAAITPAGGVSGQYLYEAFWKRQPDQDKRPTPPWSEQSDAIKTMWDGIAGDATSSRDDAAPQQRWTPAHTTAPLRQKRSQL